MEQLNFGRTRQRAKAHISDDGWEELNRHELITRLKHHSISVMPDIITPIDGETRLPLISIFSALAVGYSLLDEEGVLCFD